MSWASTIAPGAIRGMVTSMILAALSYCQSKAPALHSTTWPGLATASVALLCSPYGGLKYLCLTPVTFSISFALAVISVAALAAGSG